MNDSVTRREAVGLMLSSAIASALARPALAASAAPAANAHYDPSPSAEVDGLKARFIDVQGQRTRYYDYGKGETLLLIHGGGSGVGTECRKLPTSCEMSPMPMVWSPSRSSAPR